MIILDTNVISEAMRLNAEPRVIAWLDARDSSDIWLTAITAAELQTGVERLPPGAKRVDLQARITAILDEDFVGRILPFDMDAALFYAEIAARKMRAGKKVEALDFQVAAIARLYDSPVATRNIKHFEDCGVELINPWET